MLVELRDAAPGGVFPGPMYVCTRVLGAGCCVRGRCSQIPPPSPSCLSRSVALRAPGGSGGVSIPALCGWRGYQSGQDLSGGCGDSGLQVAGWGWHPVESLVASLDRLSPGWSLDFLSAQTLEIIPCF